MIVCNRCGKENQDHYKFCLGCGAELTSPAKPGGDIAVMKTMMADSSALAPGRPGASPTPSPYGIPGGGLPPPGPGPVPGPMGAPPLGAPPHGGGGPMGGPPGPLPPPGPLGAAPHGPGPAPFSPPGAPPPGPFGAPPAGPHAAPGPFGSPGAPPPGAPPSMGPPAGPPPGVPAPGFGGAPGFGAPPQAAPAAGPRRCPSCSTEVPPGFRFCGACGHRMDDASQPVSAPVVAPPPRATLTLIRPDGSEGGAFELKQGENTIGRNAGAIFENDGYLSPTHAELVVTPTSATVRDLGSLNGVFVKMTEEEEIQPGQVFRIGQELLRFDLVTPPEPAPDGTEVMGSPNPGYWGKITVIIGKDVDGSAFPLLGESVTLGREKGEINFPDDGYVSGLHAKVSIRDGRVYLADLGSSNGTFFKINGERTLANDSYVLLGQQLFRLNL